MRLSPLLEFVHHPGHGSGKDIGIETHFLQYLQGRLAYIHTNIHDIWGDLFFNKIHTCFLAIRRTEIPAESATIVNFTLSQKLIHTSLEH